MCNYCEVLRQRPTYLCDSSPDLDLKSDWVHIFEDVDLDFYLFKYTVSQKKFPPLNSL